MSGRGGSPTQARRDGFVANSSYAKRSVDSRSIRWMTWNHCFWLLTLLVRRDCKGSEK